jgi:peptidyl-prolyl cis-trans isomerase SurA
MVAMESNPVRRWTAIVAALGTVCVLGQGRLLGQQAAGTQAVTQAGQVQAPAPVVGTALADQGTVLDKVIAVVNGDVILDSDVDEERRFEEIQPYREATTFSRDRAIRRLVDRALILQQADLEEDGPVSDQDLDAQLTKLRQDIPACKQYHCETDAGWEKYLADHGFTVAEFRDRWRKRMELLKFIEVRFRNGISISDKEIKEYYEKTMLPEYAKRNVTPPPLDTISKRIEEVLLQQQVGSLLQDWLKSLRAQGSVRMMTPGEVVP